MIYSYTDFIFHLTLVKINEDGKKTKRSDVLEQSSNIVVSILNQECDIRLDFDVTDDMIEVEEARINLPIKQEDSKYLKKNITVQINGFIGNNRWACEQEVSYVGENLLDKVIRYDE